MWASPQDLRSVLATWSWLFLNWKEEEGEREKEIDILKWKPHRPTTLVQSRRNQSKSVDTRGWGHKGTHSGGRCRMSYSDSPNRATGLAYISVYHKSFLNFLFHPRIHTGEELTTGVFITLWEYSNGEHNFGCQQPNLEHCLCLLRAMWVRDYRYNIYTQIAIHKNLGR